MPKPRLVILAHYDRTPLSNKIYHDGWEWRIDLGHGVSIVSDKLEPYTRSHDAKRGAFTVVKRLGEEFGAIQGFYFYPLDPAEFFSEIYICKPTKDTNG